ncbi:hypothetical protein FA15DRAFT_604940 [Coprinopsis marcescibilis]|uniref:DUF2415 domain-containing protein n=1 Tax=Coprinopsis marcescibilis TaxID=230819 RepID=A0A5C3KC33_COPMA|nr:hypothetical protein FA15DRAFT_604940 [Coprinopsis marcescibilis]
MSSSSFLLPKPTAIAQGPITIDHPQLRDLIICPQQRGAVTYVRESTVVEQNIRITNAPIRTLSPLLFTPSSLTAIALDNDTLVAAGGSLTTETDLHLSYHRSDGEEPVWEYSCSLTGTLNNSLLLTRSNSSGAEPRLGVTNNDRSFRLYDCAIRRQPIRYALGARSDEQLECVGCLRLDTAVNCSALSPCGRFMISVGDLPNAYLHHVSGSSRVTFHPISTVPIPEPTNTPPNYPTTRPSDFTAAFAACWSKDGSKYAVGSQEGVVAVWDIRSTTKPLHVYQVDKMRMGSGSVGQWVSWDPSDWFHSDAPPWSVRSLKFGGDENGVNEVLVFAEHTHLIHVIDGKTFDPDTRQIVRIPSKIVEPEPPSPPLLSTSSPPQSPLAMIQLDLPSHTPSVIMSDSYSYPNPGSAYTFPISERYSTEYESDSDQWEDSDMDDEDCSRDVRTPTPMSTARTIPFPPQSSPPEPYSGTFSNGHPFPAPTRFEYDDELDIAGICFDPSGKWLYVGTSEGIVEWEVGRR